MNMFDFAFNQFLKFRLGNASEQPGHCLLHDISPSALFPITEICSTVERSGKLMQYSELLDVEESKIRLCIISDTHERHGALGITPPCDILIHGGDILMTSRFVSNAEAVRKLKEFNEWLGLQPALHKIIIAGNHDQVLEQLSTEDIDSIFTNASYLCNSSVTVMGLRIWGTPHSRGKSHNIAFQSKEFARQTEEHVNTLCESTGASDGVDILVTHGTCRDVAARVRPRLVHVSGHLHAMHGVYRFPTPADAETPHNWLTVAAPIMNTKYEPHQFPLMVDVDSNCTSTNTQVNNINLQGKDYS